MFILEEYQNNNDDCIRIDKALCTPFEKQILLPTDEIQYGVFDVCDKYNVILIKDDKKLRLLNHEKEIDERPWGEPERSNYATCIHWCSFLDSFFNSLPIQFMYFIIKNRSTDIASQIW